VAVLPFNNLSRDNIAGERVRDVFANLLLATGAVYVLPSGEVARGIGRANVVLPPTPSVEEVVSLGKLLQANAVITGTLKEYGEVRAGSSTANVISVSLQMYETQTGKVVWAASTTKGGIGFWDRMLGGGGEPMNKVTEDAVRDLLNKLFK
jgi:polysaccharide biosynthesis protein PelC